MPGFIADMKQPGFYGGLRSVTFDEPSALVRGETSVSIAVVAIGGSFGLWALNRTTPEGRLEGIRLDFFASTFSQFNLSVSSADLLNIDYTVGPALTSRFGGWSGRLRYYHQSSHLGDELLLADPNFERISISFEAVDLVLAREILWGPVTGRVYGGGGRVLGSDTELAPGILEWGFEVWGAEPRNFVGDTRLLPMLGTHVRALEVRGWGATTSVKAGVEWIGTGDGPRLRVLGVFLDGFVPFGQFFSDTQLSAAGVEFQLVL